MSAGRKGGQPLAAATDQTRLRAAAGRRPLLVVLFANFLVFGAGAIVIGATAPKIIRDFGWSYLAMGAVLSTGSIGYFVSTFLCGVLVRARGPRPVIVGGLVLQATGLLLFGTVATVAANLLAVGLIGLGEGGTEVVTNYTVVRLAGPGRSRLMNLMHAAFPIGAILASLAMGLLLDAHLPWQPLYRVLGGLCLGIAALLARVDFGAAGTPATGSGEPTATVVLGLLRRPLLLLLALVVLAYVGAEIGVSNWIAEYYVQALGAPIGAAAAMVSVLWMGLLGGRLLLAAAVRGGHQALLLIGLTAFSTIALAGALLPASPVVAGVLFWATGVGFSAIYPVVIVLVGEWFPAEPELAIGVVSTAGGLGSFGFPFVMAAITQAWGVRIGFWSFVVLGAVMTSAATAALRAGRGAGTAHR